jgi:N-acetyl-anhydromuramyl-L-alanine amidase AmpD
MGLNKHTFYKFENYIHQVTEKKQIYLHHTAGGGEGESTFRYWDSDSTPVATCVCISRDGTIVQGFSSQNWAYHLGLKTRHFSEYGVGYQNLDKISIGVEICNWGFLTEKNGKFYSWAKKEIPKEKVYELDTPYKGHRFFENYTDEQIESVRELLLLWKERYQIPLTYHDDIWEVTDRALKGNAGVYTHNSVRADKIDIYPHHSIVDMLKLV